MITSLWKKIGSFGLLAAGVACGSGPHDKHPVANEPAVADDPSHGESEANPANAAPWISRGVWVMPIDSALSDSFAVTAVNQPISATIAPGVVFTVAKAGFKAPKVMTGVASYGSLVVTALRDNNLKVCGDDGVSACTSAVIRIYTMGVGGPGLWNAVDGYGVPILTTGQNIGLDVAGALALGSASIPDTTHVLVLSQFTAGPTLPIPVSVDFNNAGAGSYASTLVVEYAVR